MQMLYQHELAATSLSTIFSSFNLEEYLEETEGSRSTGDSEPQLRLLNRAKKSFDYAQRLVTGTLEHRTAIDKMITRYAENWRIERMPTIDRNILRLAIYEMLHESSVPRVVIVDEAIELAKRFGSEHSGRFVNGLLDGVLQANREAAPVVGEPA